MGHRRRWCLEFVWQELECSNENNLTLSAIKPICRQTCQNFKDENRIKMTLMTFLAK
jgi:hypothetical protein